MDEDWLCIDEDDTSSRRSCTDSDVIDSETEAELYSVIHYEQNLSNIDCHNSDNKDVETSAVCVQNLSIRNINCTEEKFGNTQINVFDTLKCVSQNISHSEENKKLHDENIFLNQLAQKLNSVKKKKSHFDDNVSNFLCSNFPGDTGLNQSPEQSCLKKRKRETDVKSSKRLNSVKKNAAVIDCCDSDSSLIWTEIESSDTKDFQTNLLKDDDTIYITSDSNTDSIITSHMERESNLKNISMPNIKIGETSKDLWYVNAEDLYRQKKKSRRYHDLNVTCVNCNRKGHTARTCPLPKIIKCFLCGGAHVSSECGNRICIKCYGTGHDSKRCWMPCNSYCSVCHMKGHKPENCPDLWRRYHLTTKPGEIVKGKRRKAKTSCCYCCNCGDRGHFGAICKYTRSPKQCLLTWPCVTTYDDPEELLQKRLNGQRYSGFRRDADFQRNVLDVANDFVTERKNEQRKKKKFDFQCFKDMKKKAEREVNFPRTPKNNIPPNYSDDTMSQRANFLVNKRLKKREQNRRRKLKRRREMFKSSEHSLQAERHHEFQQFV